jgi:branched-chain amino acid transport system substrate-binding protein
MKWKNNLLMTLLLLLCTNIFGVSNNKDVPIFSFFQRLAKELPEFPPCDNVNWVDPDYTSFLQTLRPGYIENLLLVSGIKNKKESVPYLLNDLLDKVNAHYTEDTKEHNAALLCVPERTKFFVWGDLHASFHSFMRDLEYLVKEGILDERLTIIEKDCFLIVLGDAIDRGPYSMATLCLLLALHYQNPTSFFYVKGNHESYKYWENFGLKRELQIITQSINSSVGNLKEKINSFFNSLKKYVLVHTRNDQQSTILFSFNGMKYPYINVANQLDNQLGFINTNISFEKFYTKETYLIPEVLLKTEEWREEHRAQNGLGLLDQLFGATTWSVLSSPLKIHEDFYEFNYDAFAQITIYSSIRNSSIQIINRHKQDPHFIKQEPFNIVTGRPLSHAQPAPVGKDIVFGSTMSLTQGLPVISKRTKRGVNLAILEQNVKGGIGGRHIKFDVRDDYYAPLYASNNIEDFLKRGIDLILYPVGSGTLKAYINLVKQHEIAVIFPVTGNSDFGDPSLKGMLNLTAMNIEEIKAHINFFTTHQTVKSFAFFFQEDEYGRATLDAAHTLLKSKGITKWVDVPYVRGSVDFKPQIAKIKKSNVEAIGLLCTPEAAQEFIRRINLEALNNKILFGLSTLTSTAFKSFIEKKGIPFYFSSRVPNPETSILPIVQEYRELMNRDYYNYDNASLEGYLGTRFLLDILLGMPGVIDKKTIVAGIEGAGRRSFGGLNLLYKPTDRSLNMSVWLEGPNGQWLEIPDKMQ